VDLAARAAGVTRLADLGAPTARGADMAGIQGVLGDLLEAMTAVVGADGGILHLYDGHSDDLFAQVATAALGDGDGTARIRRAEGAVGGALQSLAPVSVARDGLSDTELRWLPDVRMIYCAPLLTLTREPMGVVSLLFRRAVRPAVREETLIAAFADQAAEMIERAHLHSEGRALLVRDQLRSSQLAQLAEVSRDLMGELVLDDLLRTVAEAARAIIGAHQVVASRLVRGWTEAFTYVSLSEKYARWRGYDRVPKGLGVLNYVTRENRPLRLTATELAAHPEWRGMRDAPDHPPLPNYLAAPLVARDRRNLGLIQLSDKAGDPSGAVGDFTPEDEHLLVALAQLASAAIENLEMRERERLAGQRVDASARSLKLLSDASRALAETLEVDATLDTITSLAVPVLGDWCGVHLLDASGELQLAAHAAEEPRIDSVLGGSAEETRDRGGIDLEHALDTGATQRSASLPSPVLEELSSAFPDRAVDPGTVLVVPLTAHGRALGTLTLVRIPGPPYTGGEAELAEELARRAALAVDNATRYASERDTALVLQRSMLPELRPFAPGLRVASRYLPGAEGLNVGGDWYDLIPLVDGRHGLVVGDVAGRGIAAAAGMGQLRAVVRAYALEGHSPARLLEQMDSFVTMQRTVSFVTCLYAVIDTSARTLTVASAGHLPPLLLDDRGAHLVEVPTGAPLGTSFGGFQDMTIALEPESTVLLYTDGLVEERTRPIDEGLATLCAAASRWRRSPEALCDGVLLIMSERRPLEDDTALLAVSLDPSPGPDDACVRENFVLPAEPSSAGAARAELNKILHSCGAAPEVEVAQLLVTEVVANAIRHAEGERVELAVSIDDAAVRVEVGDEGDSDPVPGPPPGIEDPGGRGLMIVEALASRWGYERRPDGGKRVWFELDR
jgi:GAF domain-containing protein/anti-sigma regulatory factor (Ser/Thr protein kinase)